MCQNYESLLPPIPVAVYMYHTVVTFCSVYTGPSCGVCIAYTSRAGCLFCFHTSWRDLNMRRGRLIGLVVGLGLVTA